jgi:hypothetical protein
LPGKIKSGDLFIGKTRKQMGLNGWLQSVEAWKWSCPGFQMWNSFKQSLCFVRMGIWPYAYVFQYLCDGVDAWNGDGQSVCYVCYEPNILVFHEPSGERDMSLWACPIHLVWSYRHGRLWQPGRLDCTAHPLHFVSQKLWLSLFFLYKGCLVPT